QRFTVQGGTVGQVWLFGEGAGDHRRVGAQSCARVPGGSIAQSGAQQGGRARDLVHLSVDAGEEQEQAAIIVLELRIDFFVSQHALRLAVPVGVVLAAGRGKGLCRPFRRREQGVDLGQVGAAQRVQLRRGRVDRRKQLQ